MAVVTTKVSESDGCAIYKVANSVSATPSDEIPAAIAGWQEAMVLIGTVHVDSTGATVDILAYGLAVSGGSLNQLPALSNNELRAKYTKAGTVREVGKMRNLPPLLKVGFTDATLDCDLWVVLLKPAKN